MITGVKQKIISLVASMSPAAAVSTTQSHAVVLVFVDYTTITGNEPPTTQHAGDPRRDWWPMVDLSMRPYLNKTGEPMKTRVSLRALAITAVAVVVGSVILAPSPAAYAGPAPQVEYVYDVMVRRHYNFGSPAEAVDYGYGICDKVSRGGSYAQVMADVKGDVVPNDEFAANYLVSYAVNLLCPALIWRLRNSAANYRPPSGG